MPDIASALRAIDHRGKIRVLAGEYHETLVEVDKDVSIVGEIRNSVVIHGIVTVHDCSNAGNAELAYVTVDVSGCNYAVHRPDRATGNPSVHHCNLTGGNDVFALQSDITLRSNRI